MKKLNIYKTINLFIKSTNDFDVEKALQLFASDAEIDDVSVGKKFTNTTGVRNYLEQFFVGYNTFTKLLSIELINDFNANTKVDFTGDFGHETGVLNFFINKDGLINLINAHLD